MARAVHQPWTSPFTPISNPSSRAADRAFLEPVLTFFESLFNLLLSLHNLKLTASFPVSLIATELPPLLLHFTPFYHHISTKPITQDVLYLLGVRIDHDLNLHTFRDVLISQKRPSGSS
jgi:hypothetical protein